MFFVNEQLDVTRDLRELAIIQSFFMEMLAQPGYESSVHEYLLKIIQKR